MHTLLVVGLGAASLGASAAELTHERQLYELLNERLLLMREVAAHKSLNGIPIEDVSRERVVIGAAVADGLRRGILPESSRRFFTAQIEAAKTIQQHWFDRWHQAGAPDQAPDLVVEIRPRLLRLGQDIVDASAVPGLSHSRELFYSSLSVEGLDQSGKDRLFEALAGIRVFRSRFEQIAATGVLRVGTTGDYEPFSYSVGSNPAGLQGIDIDLARELSAALQVDLELVPTSWPTLIEDLLAGKFDLVMSGVSRTVERARVGYLSHPYHKGGKTPVARCEDKDRFNSLAAIDRPEVRVIVNPGGTNEAFVDGQIHQAQKILHADNRTIFAALIAGQADVMVTDQIEVLLQTRKKPGLCGTMAVPLTYQEKGFLMPRDDELKTFVDTWLALKLADGSVDRLFEKYLAAP